jgi:hypothetical protein
MARDTAAYQYRRLPGGKADKGRKTPAVKNGAKRHGSIGTGQSPLQIFQGQPPAVSANNSIITVNGPQYQRQGNGKTVSPRVLRPSEKRTNRQCIHSFPRPPVCPRPQVQIQLIYSRLFDQQRKTCFFHPFFTPKPRQNPGYDKKTTFPAETAKTQIQAPRKPGFRDGGTSAKETEALPPRRPALLRPRKNLFPQPVYPLEQGFLPEDLRLGKEIFRPGPKAGTQPLPLSFNRQDLPGHPLPGFGGDETGGEGLGFPQGVQVSSPAGELFLQKGNKPVAYPVTKIMVIPITCIGTPGYSPGFEVGDHIGTA